MIVVHGSQPMIGRSLVWAQFSIRDRLFWALIEKGLGKTLIHTIAGTRCSANRNYPHRIEASDPRNQGMLGSSRSYRPSFPTRWACDGARVWRRERPTGLCYHRRRVGSLT